VLLAAGSGPATSTPQLEMLPAALRTLASSVIAGEILAYARGEPER
jgi:hypothetical protein